MSAAALLGSWFLIFSLFIGVASAAPVHLVDENPVDSKVLEDGSLWIDFGRVSFGNLRLTIPKNAQTNLRFHFGEKSADGRIDRKPPGTVRYAVAEVAAKPGASLVVAPPADKRNTTHPSAVLTPREWGVVLPFRWVEIEGWPSGAGADGIIRQSAFASTWDDKAASFSSSDETLDRIWELCRYSIKATTFAGVYVDGDRERIPYEADAYLNQLSHYATDRDIQMARDTYDQLMAHPTWPTEWAPHMVFMAHADWMHTGDAEWLKPRYEALKKKLLLERAGEDGLIRSNKEQQKKTDIVDWPKTERDGYVFTEINTVVNAFHLSAITKMADIARAVGKEEEAKEYEARFRNTHAAFQKSLYIPEKHAYRDGAGTDQTSSHASLFPLAFDLVPESDRKDVAGFLAKRGMRCSVYAAQYLMESMFRNGHDKEAMQLILADGDRSWKHMVNSGTTISWEAWDQKYKPNQDWNHAWGAAPANLLPRFVLGVEAKTPGWKSTRISPRTSGLQHAKGKIPTPHGPIDVAWKKNDSFDISITLPVGIEASIDLPAANADDKVWMNDKIVETTRMGDRLILAKPIKGSSTITVRP
jgi:hypothetical protein